MDSHAGIELDAAQALFAARLLEAAVHHPGPWAFRWGDIEVPAEKVLTEDGVLFTGRFPEICYLERPEGGLSLLCEGTVLAIRPPDDFEHPGDTGFLVTWKVLARRQAVGL